ncbi:hypothetical protein ABFS83_04G004000 [Erythranthe nasuta]
MNNEISPLKLVKQPFMDSQISRTSSLPWILVIDTLARSKQVKLSLLLDLLDNTPAMPDDLGKNVRELLSLRLLESFSAQGALASPVPSPASQKIRLDPSDCCENVLQQILAETSTSHLKPAGLEMSKWDLQPFIDHKRSNLSKPALEQLKDAILSGKPSHFASLREHSGLPIGNPMDDNNDDHSNLPDENLVEVSRKRKSTSESVEGKSYEKDLNNKSVEEQEQDHSIEEPKECDKEVFNSHKQTNEGVDKFDGKKRQDRAAEDAEGGRKDLSGLITSDKDMDKLEQTFRKNVSIGEAEQYNGVPSGSDCLPNNLPNENLEEIFLCSSYRAIPHPRRPRIRWTKKEEKALKKWMRKLHNDDDKSIPYKEILEAGAGVFHPRRTPTDLKDKWRNICKANLRTA